MRPLIIYYLIFGFGLLGLNYAFCHDTNPPTASQVVRTITFWPAHALKLYKDDSPLTCANLTIPLDDTPSSSSPRPQNSTFEGSSL